MAIRLVPVMHYTCQQYSCLVDLSFPLPTTSGQVFESPHQLQNLFPKRCPANKTAGHLFGTFFFCLYPSKIIASLEMFFGVLDPSVYSNSHNPLFCRKYTDENLLSRLKTPWTSHIHINISSTFVPRF